MRRALEHHMTRHRRLLGRSGRSSLHWYGAAMQDFLALSTLREGNNTVLGNLASGGGIRQANARQIMLSAWEGAGEDEGQRSAHLGTG